MAPLRLRARGWGWGLAILGRLLGQEGFPAVGALPLLDRGDQRQLRQVPIPLLLPRLTCRGVLEWRTVAWLASFGSWVRKLALLGLAILDRLEEGQSAQDPAHAAPREDAAPRRHGAEDHPAKAARERAPWLPGVPQGSSPYAAPWHLVSVLYL